MQAVIMVAGEGRRMRPLTLEKPKSLIEVAGRPILERIIDALPSEADEIILVVGYKGDQIKKHFGESYKGRSINYVFQWMPAGTAHALSIAVPLLHDEKFFLLCGDDLHGPRALREMLNYPLAILATTHEDPSRFGVIERKADGTIDNFVEKPQHPASNLISTGALLLDKRVLGYEAPRHETGEYFITDPFRALAKEHPVMVVEQDFWVPIGYPEDIPAAEAKLAMLDLDNDSENNRSDV